MATDSLQPKTAPEAPPERFDVLNALLNIKGTVQLSRRAVYDTMSLCTLRDHPEESAETLQSAEGALTLTEAAIERLYGQLVATGADAWPAAPEDEVAHG